MLYLVQWDYHSTRATLRAGEIVEIDDDLAGWLKADSPGVIVPAPEPERIVEAPPHDRMVRKGRKR